jgi:hypothetical protein
MFGYWYERGDIEGKVRDNCSYISKFIYNFVATNKKL